MTSFKRDGTGVATPVWFVSDGRRLFALTDLHSAKVRRMRRNPRVLVASCRADGKLRSRPVPARVEVLTATPDLERVRELLLQRYKISYRLVMLISRLGRRVRGQRSLADGAAPAITSSLSHESGKPPKPSGFLFISQACVQSSFTQLGTINPSITISASSRVKVTLSGCISTSAADPLGEWRLSIDSGASTVQLGRLGATPPI